MPQAKYPQRSQPNRRRLGISRFNPLQPIPTPASITASGGGGAAAALNGVYLLTGLGLYQKADGTCALVWSNTGTWYCWNQEPGFTGTQVISHAGTTDAVPASGWTQNLGSGAVPTFAETP